MAQMYADEERSSICVPSASSADGPPPAQMPKNETVFKRVSGAVREKGLIRGWRRWTQMKSGLPSAFHLRHLRMVLPRRKCRKMRLFSNKFPAYRAHGPEKHVFECRSSAA